MPGVSIQVTGKPEAVRLFLDKKLPRLILEQPESAMNPFFLLDGSG